MASIGMHDQRNFCAIQVLTAHDLSRKDKAMASAAGQKPMILTAAEADRQRFEANARLEEGRVKLPARRSNGLVLYAVGALLLLVVGYLLFSGNWNTMMLFPTVSETVPSPDIDATVPPVPSAPPPADAPAANP
jgi:hypothetical protein